MARDNYKFEKRRKEIAKKKKKEEKRLKKLAKKSPEEDQGSEGSDDQGQATEVIQGQEGPKMDGPDETNEAMPISDR